MNNQMVELVTIRLNNLNMEENCCGCVCRYKLKSFRTNENACCLRRAINRSVVVTEKLYC